MACSLPRALLVLVLALPGVLVIAAPIHDAVAQADPRVEARTRYNAGKQKYDAADYRGAVADFTAADQLAPSAVNDFNIALSYERLDEPAQAVKYYRSYLNRMPNAPNRAEVETAVQRLDAAAKAADAAAAARTAEEKARADEAARLAEEARQEALRRNPPAGGDPGTAAGVGGSPPGYPATGDADLDRVAAIDLAPIRGAGALPPPSAQAGAAPSGDPAPASADPAVPVTPKAKPFYKSPVFWVIAAVGVYVLVVLASDDSSGDPQNGIGRRYLPLPDGPGAMRGGGATVMRF